MFLMVGQTIKTLSFVFRGIKKKQRKNWKKFVRL